MEDEGTAEDDNDADDDEGNRRRHDHLDDFGKGRHGGQGFLVGMSLLAKLP